MTDIRFLLLDQTEGRVSSGKLGRQKGKASLVYQTEHDWHGFSLQLHHMPAVWTQRPQRIQDYVEKQRRLVKNLWTARELDEYLPGIAQPFPSPQLASFILKNMPFRQILILNRGSGETGPCWQWQEMFLEDCYKELNGLYLLGTAQKEEGLFSEQQLFLEQRLQERIYEDSGLLTVIADRIPEVDGCKSVFVDAQSCIYSDYRKIPIGCQYLDLSSDREKQRHFAIKRTDISYMSVRNYLDTAIKARYNAM